MKLDIVLSIPSLLRIVRPFWNVSPIKKVQDDVYSMFVVAAQHHARRAHVGSSFNAFQHCRRDYSLFGGRYIRFPAQIDVFRDHLISFLSRAATILTRSLRLRQPMEISNA